MNAGRRAADAVYDARGAKEKERVSLPTHRWRDVAAISELKDLDAARSAICGWGMEVALLEARYLFEATLHLHLQRVIHRHIQN